DRAVVFCADVACFSSKKRVLGIKRARASVSIVVLALVCTAPHTAVSSTTRRREEEAHTRLTQGGISTNNPAHASKQKARQTRTVRRTSSDPASGKRLLRTSYLPTTRACSIFERGPSFSPL